MTGCRGVTLRYGSFVSSGSFCHSQVTDPEMQQLPVQLHVNVHGLCVHMLPVQHCAARLLSSDPYRQGLLP